MDNIRNVQADLSLLAQGYLTSNENFIWDKVCPIITIKKEKFSVPKFGREHFQLNRTKRAVRGATNVLSWEAGDPITGKLQEEDLAFPVDERELEENELLDLKRYGTRVTSEGINRNIEKAVADLYQDETRYPTGHKITLSGTSKFSDDASNPIKTFRQAHAQLRGQIARKGTVAWFGAVAWDAFCENANVLDRLKHTQTGLVDETIAAKLLKVRAVYVGNCIYSENGTSVDIWTDKAGLLYLPDTPPEQRSNYEPSFAYTFRKEGRPEVDEYFEEGGKIEMIRTTDLLASVICGADAGYLIQDCV